MAPASMTAASMTATTVCMREGWPQHHCDDRNGEAGQQLATISHGCSPAQGMMNCLIHGI
jgi:hypothetical protein